MSGFEPVGSFPVASVPAGSGLVPAQIRRRALLFANVGASIVTPVINPPVVTVPVPDRYDLNIINPGAEFRDLTGWTAITGDPSAQIAPGVSATTAHSGNWYFYGGSTTISIIRQRLTVPETYQGKNLHNAIDENKALMNWLYYADRQLSPPDQTCVSVQYLNEAGFPIGTYVPPMDTTTTAWAQNTILEKPIPAGTRFINLDVLAYEGNPTSNDANTDDHEAWITFKESIYPLELPLLNPDADLGTIGGWSIVSGAPTVSPSASTFARSGRYFWYGGTVAFSSMSQDVAIPAAAIADVDAGLVSLNYFWYQSANDTDQQRLRVEFLDSVLALIASDTPALTSDGGAPFNWVAKSSTPAVPVGTRTIRIFNDMQRVTGTSNDGLSAAYRMRLLK